MGDALTIVAVDDEPANLELFKRVLDGSGHRLIAAGSGAEALGQMEIYGADLLLVDFSMPNMNGVEFIERARVIEPDAIAIMVTGYPELHEVADAQRRGLVSNTLAKPWLATELKKLVEGVLADRIKS